MEQLSVSLAVEASEGLYWQGIETSVLTEESELPYEETALHGRRPNVTITDSSDQRHHQQQHPVGEHSNQPTTKWFCVGVVPPSLTQQQKKIVVNFHPHNKENEKGKYPGLFVGIGLRVDSLSLYERHTQITTIIIHRINKRKIFRKSTTISMLSIDVCVVVNVCQYLGRVGATWK